MKKINFIFLILLLFQGCGRNVQKDLENIIADYQQKDCNDFQRKTFCYLSK